MLPSWAFLLAFTLIFVGLRALGVFYVGAHGWFVLMPGQKVAVFVTLAASAALLTFSLVRQMVPGHQSLLRPGLLPADTCRLGRSNLEGAVHVYEMPTLQN